MLNTGVTVGKFMPLHVGHEFMIETAAKFLNHLIVVVDGTEDDEIPLSERFELIYDKYKSNSKIIVTSLVNDIGDDWSRDEYGTITDPAFWDLWTKAFKKIAPTATHFVSSDRYGERAAQELGMKWFPIDPDRETFKISATDIRVDSYYNYGYIANEFKHLYTKFVAIVGPESTGKSTLVRELGETFNAPTVPEYGRIVSEIKNNELNEDDFKTFGSIQEIMIDTAASKSNGLVISDTEAFTTYLYADIYLNKNMKELRTDAIFQDFDLYLLLKPNMPWVNDGTRVQPNQLEREAFFEAFKQFLDENNKPYKIIDSKNWADRYYFAMSNIEEMLYK